MVQGWANPTNNKLIMLNFGLSLSLFLLFYYGMTVFAKKSSIVSQSRHLWTGVLPIYPNHQVGFQFSAKIANDLSFINRMMDDRKTFQHQQFLEIPKGAVKVSHFNQEPIIQKDSKENDVYNNIGFSNRNFWVFCVNGKQLPYLQ